MKKNLITAIIILFTQFCFAQDFWMQLNLPGDTTLNALAGNSEGTVFAATRKGVHLSFDSGLNWTNTEITNSAYRIFVDKEDRIFAAIYPNIHYSANNGDSWSEIICPPVGIVTFYFNNNTILFGNWGSIYKSSDFGDTWTQTLEISNAKEVASIIEAADETLYAGITAWSVPGGGVYRSMDNGDTWEHVGLWNHYIRSLATNSQGTLFAGSIGDGVGIYSSDDSGETWKGLKNDVFVTSIVVTPEDAIYIGCSNEHGTQGGVFRSLDDGETWEMINTGLIGWENQNIYGLTLSPNGYLYAYGNHLHRSNEPVFSSNSIEHNDFQTAIYPNPFTSNLNISLSHNSFVSEGTMVTIYDVLGNVVFNQMISGYNLHYILNTEFLKPGFYFLSIDANGKRYSKPIIKAL